MPIAAAGLALACAAAHAQDNPAARRGANDLGKLAGIWNGANIERRSHCAATQNNGQHGTYAEYVVTLDTGAAAFGINEYAVTGLSCTYFGNYAAGNLGPQWDGNYSCSDGKRGTFRSQSFLITPTEMQIRLAIKLNGSEICDIDAILGGSRF